jgi:hypothetical protein
MNVRKAEVEKKKEKKKKRKKKEKDFVYGRATPFGTGGKGRCP